MATELVERALTPIEIKQRQVDHLRLLTEIDNYQSEIDEHRRCAKDAANEVARIQSRERELRRELRSGTCWESVHVEPRQKSLEFADTLRERPTDPNHTGVIRRHDGLCLSSVNGSHDVYLNEDGTDYCSLCEPGLKKDRGISATTDEPDPETDPPGPGCDHTGIGLPGCEICDYRDPGHDKPELRDVFAEVYPMVESWDALAHELSGTLTPEQYGALPIMQPWPPSSVAFQEVAHWSRVNRAHYERQAAKQRGEPSIDGLYVPGIPPMPKVLRDALGKLAPKGKKGARPLSNPPKKRRSGSTANSP